MKKFFKWTGSVFLALIIVMMIFAFLGKNETLDLNIQSIDLKQISDGTYMGNYENFRWSTQVEVTVQDHKITKIQQLKIQDGRNKLVEELREKIIKQQSPDVDVYTGATASSNSYLRAVEIALENATK